MGRIILFPGLGADERMFVPLREEGLKFETTRLPVPQAGETLTVYGPRVAHEMGVGKGDVVGGCSFGSLVATAAARQIPCRGLLLVGGALNGRTVRSIGRWPRWMRQSFPLRLFKPFLRNEKTVEMIFGPENQEMKDLALAMLAETPDGLLLRGGRMIALYEDSAPPLCPVWAIHGGRDRVMMPPPVPMCQMIPEAGHGLIYTHPRAVAAFLRSRCPKSEV